MIFHNLAMYIDDNNVSLQKKDHDNVHLEVKN